MDLFCPHCTRRVSIPDDRAGLVSNCPLCGKQFMAPSLAPATPPAPKPPPAPAGYDMGPPPSPPPPGGAAPPPPPKTSQPEPTLAPTPPLPPGEYTRTVTFQLCPMWLCYVPSACLVLIFFLSFFGWHQPELALAPPPSQTTTASPTVLLNPAFSLWGLAFEKGILLFVGYWILLILSLCLAVASLVEEKKLIASPAPLAPFMMWKDLIVALFLGIGCLLFAVDYLDATFNYRVSPILLAMKLAVRLHFLATLASLLMFWLHWRALKNTPLPKCELRW